ncbi:uncharacterized protein BO72DRAFT_458334 [Aspergillus fijiensis CBS 313.89]|uniref:Uncharacterized protein n=1 Tax=Aspergillus fijiensis CBS 313.89 TaxID=1448319 RepID=A0A8G1VYI9_9EURO|nr:uncharacterized protein BO72DRAFT_458334 [Aspergillus fijiensis CBS 313.89]RAK77775.1 hypothetical protein BO72DRAFT_458334 [Aspergillus fijiensis CBS 313.89]
MFDIPRFDQPDAPAIAQAKRAAPAPLQYIARYLQEERYFVASRTKSPPRIIFFCRWPLTQRVLAMFLKMLGIGICQKWAYQSPKERGNVAATFTSKDSGAEVLVATYRLASVGLNL